MRPEAQTIPHPPSQYLRQVFVDTLVYKPENVAQLKEAWSYSTGIKRGHEGAPLVAGGTVYIVTPFPNVLIALNAADVHRLLEADVGPDLAGVGRTVDPVTP